MCLGSSMISFESVFFFSAILRLCPHIKLIKNTHPTKRASPDVCTKFRALFKKTRTRESHSALLYLRLKCLRTHLHEGSTALKGAMITKPRTFKDSGGKRGGRSLQCLLNMYGHTTLHSGDNQLTDHWEDKDRCIPGFSSVPASFRTHFYGFANEELEN